MKIKFKAIIALTFATIFTITGCKKWLAEPRPEVEVPIEEIGVGSAGLDAALTGAWAWWTASQVAGGNLFTYPEAMSDYVAMTNQTPSRLYNTYKRDLQIDDYGLIGEIGQRGSRAENLVNSVIRNTSISPPTDVAWAQNGDRIKGEAYFLRGWMHFEYILAMGDQWDTKNPSANTAARGPLIRFKPILDLADLAQARTPLAAAYDSVINDLKKAEILLPEYYDPAIHNASFSARANKFAASAMLAKVYWQQNDFDKALVQINKVIGNVAGVSAFPLASNFSDVYSRLGITSTTNKQLKGEVILEYVAVAPTDKIASRGGQVLDNFWARSGRTSAYFGPYFQSLVSFNTVLDKRYKELINPSFTQNNPPDSYSGWSTKKFNTKFANIVYIRSAQLLLMRAEINARKTLPSDAIKDLNLVKQRAGLLPVATADFATSGALIADIIRERARELNAEGYRSHELKRLGSLTDGQPDEVKFLRGDRNGGVDCGQGGLGCIPVKWNDRKLTYLITQDEMNVNPLANNN